MTDSTPPSAEDTLAQLQRQLDELTTTLESLRSENNRLLQSLQQADEKRARFISLVSHELRTPMTAIKGYADLLLRGAVGPLNEQQRNFVNIILSNVERMAGLVGNLADISRLESGRLALKIAPTFLPAQLEEALRPLRAKLAEKGLSFSTDISLSLPQLSADAARLVQVLSNLLSNAWKYTPAGGQISMRTFREGEVMRIEVCDTGIGIRPEEQSRVFTQFFRSEDPAVRQESGWGLGLHLAKGLVEAMGGKIGFTSDPAIGSTFWFTLPLAPSEKQG